jgi:hemoglobin/transferrin/lactoferrin receptor protein
MEVSMSVEVVGRGVSPVGRASAIVSIALAILTFAPSGASAQETAGWRRGIVVDESGGGIGEARVTVRSAGGAILRDATTAADGTFVVGPLRPGSYVLGVSARRFAGRQIGLEVDRTETPRLRITLGLPPVTSEVTVTADRGATADIVRTPAIVTVRDADDFRTRPLATLGNALEGAAGVMVQQSTYGQASPFLRGLTGYQVLNLVDGVRVNNTTFRSGPNQYLAFVDPSQGERIEAMLGPASAQFGSDAMGGAIQVLTPHVDFQTTRRLRTSAGVNLFAGSADEARGAGTTLFLQGRNVSTLFGGSWRELGDLRAGGGTDSHHALRRFFGLNDDRIQEVLGDRQLDTGFTQHGLHAKVAARLGSAQNLSAWYQRSEQEDVRGYKDLWGGLGRVRSDFDPQELQLFYTRYERLGLGHLHWLSGTFSANAQRDGSVRQNLRPTDTIVRDDVAVDAFGYLLQGGVQMGSRQSMVFGGEVYDEHVDARRDETNPTTGATVQKRALYPNGSRYVTSGLFVQNEIDLLRGDRGRAVIARLGGRYTHIGARTDADANLNASGQSLGVADSEESYHDWTFNAAVTWSVNQVLSVHGLVGRGFRAPNLNDLGALGLNDLGYEIPGASAIDARGLIGTSDGEGAGSSGRAVSPLSSERLLNYELGVALNWDEVYVRVQGFDAELRDPIVRRSLVFPIESAPAMLAGLPVTPIPPTAAQQEQGVVSVATALDPRAVKAFVNEGRARYYGLDTVLRYRIAPRWAVDANYSHLVGHDLDPTRPVRRLPPSQSFISLRYQPGGLVSWLEGSVQLAGAQTELNGGDITDERIGAARRRSDIADFFRGGRIRPFTIPGADGLVGTIDDVFQPTGETLAQIADRVLPIGSTINGVTVLNDGTRVPLYTRTAGFATVNLRAGVRLTDYLDVTLALTNALDRNYRVHGSGVDAPGRSFFAAVRWSH